MSCSVIIVTHNHASVLGRCLQSVKPWAQDYWVIDGGSQDSTLRIAQQYGASVHCDPSATPYQRLQQGFAMATQPWVLWLYPWEWVPGEWMLGEGAFESDASMLQTLQRITSNTEPPHAYYGISKRWFFQDVWQPIAASNELFSPQPQLCLRSQGAPPERLLKQPLQAKHCPYPLLGGHIATAPWVNLAHWASDELDGPSSQVSKAFAKTLKMNR